VPEADIRAAMRGIIIEERVVAEGAAATAVAALLGERAGAKDAQTVAVVLSGANVDAEKLRAII
jgi:threonine dehydratase